MWMIIIDVSYRLQFSTVLTGWYCFPATDNDPEVLVQLHTANTDLGVLVQNTTAFVDWWGDMIQSLKYLEATIPLIKPDGSNPFRTERVTDKWHDVSEEYALYRRRVSYCYPIISRLTICLIRIVDDRSTRLLL